MFWPLLLIIAGLIALVVGLASAFGSPFASPTPLQRALCWLVPLGFGAAAVGVIWALVALIAGAVA